MEKDVSIPDDDEYSKLSPYRKRWIEEDEMIKFKENTDVKAYELKSGSLVYRKSLSPSSRTQLHTRLLTRKRTRAHRERERRWADDN